ncbi:hypothetical protein [Duganella sp. CF517]|uniref:hypothetical protein n=1 Tax=Duganella sp. CF517 TaxID=1881038 RepID=UPI0011609F51|nr:hypothetical protein [Duganella sp. CF517]
MGGLTYSNGNYAFVIKVDSFFGNPRWNQPPAQAYNGAFGAPPQSGICIDKLLVENTFGLKPFLTSKFEVAVIKRFHTSRHRAAGAPFDHSPIHPRHFARHASGY